MQLNPTVTADFRDYGFDDAATFSVSTADPDGAVLRITADDGSFDVAATLDRATARRLGTDILMLVGSPLACTNEDIVYPTLPNFDAETASHTSAAVLKLFATDGMIDLLIGPGEASLVDWEFVDEYVIDIAQRLIAFAGPDLAIDLDADRR